MVYYNVSKHIIDNNYYVETNAIETSDTIRESVIHDLSD